METKILSQIRDAISYYNTPVESLDIDKKRVDSYKFDLDEDFLKDIIEWHSIKFPKKMMNRVRIMGLALFLLWQRNTAMLIDHIMLTTTLSPDEVLTAKLICKEHMEEKFKKCTTLSSTMKMVHTFNESLELSEIYYKYSSFTMN